MRRVVAALAAIVLLALLPCAPADAQLGLKLSEKDEIEIGRQAAAAVEKEQKILRDETVRRWVDRVGQRLVKKSGRPNIAYTFKVVDSPEVNAFALPGGFIYVNRGLIAMATSEDEVAGALAHEIGHVVARHGAEQIRRAQATELGLGALGAVLGKGTKGEIAGVASKMVASGVFMKYSRDAEREADRLGVENMTAAGYDPHGMITLFEKLESLRKEQPNAVEKFFASHPSPEERIANVTPLVASSPSRRPSRREEQTFASIKRRVASDTATAKSGGSKKGTGLASDGSAKPAAKPRAPGRIITDPRDRDIAARFAPIFVQGLGDAPRFDYITRFDFDGDWRGDNNWDNSAKTSYKLPASVYYSVAETPTHYFVHYAAFHPRDYKGGDKKGAILSEAIRIGVAAGGKFDPTGLADEAVLAHENDLEGALVVVEKRGTSYENGRVVYVETLAHNKFLRYVPEDAPRSGFETVKVKDEHPRLFVEPKGHGIEASTGSDDQREDATNGVLVYRYTARAEDPTKASGGRVGYDLVPISDTLWRRAQTGTGETYGAAYEYAPVAVAHSLAGGKSSNQTQTVGDLGVAFLGKVGAPNMARAPWGWFDNGERDRPLGEWFFDPAAVVKRHFRLGDEFSTVYVHNPPLGIAR